MKLLNELQERRRVLCEARDLTRADLLQTESKLYDLDRAIAALKPPAEAAPEPQEIETSSQSEPFVSWPAETELQPLPGGAEESRDHSDDASEFSEEGYAPVVEAEPVVDPIWNEPTQATKLEADALSKALDYYDPKAVAERERFNPWGGVSNLFGKPKVDA